MSDSRTPEVPQEFLLVSDPNERWSLLRECVRISAPTLFWIRDREITLQGFFHNRPAPREDTFLIHPPFDFTAAAFESELNKRGTREIYFNASLSKASILFKSHLISVHEGRLLIGSPSKIYKVQRRIQPRLVLRDGYVLKAAFHHPVAGASERKVYDISSGGISILTQPFEAAIFPVGYRIQGMKFTIAREEISVDAEVRHNKQLRGKDSLKVGFQFVRIRESDSALIAKYVHDENMRFLSRFL